MKNTLFSGLVWIFSGLALVSYGLWGLSNEEVPGVENLVNFINSASGNLLYVAAFLAIFFEGLYVVGSVIPGTTLVLLIAIVSQAGGWLNYLLIIVAIYLGWLLAGAVNIFAADFLTKRLPRPKPDDAMNSFSEVTWFPAFRANTEVSQVIEGYDRNKVFWESFKIKTYASIGLSAYALVIPLLIDIGDMNNEEGFRSLAIIAVINFAVGCYKIYHHYKKPL